MNKNKQIKNAKDALLSRKQLCSLYHLHLPLLHHILPLYIGLNLLKQVSMTCDNADIRSPVYRSYNVCTANDTFLI